MPGTRWLSTGEAAKLCSVTPDAVQKWIRTGRLSAQRTAGGHYRIAENDILPFVTGRSEQRWFAAPPKACTPQPFRCWEYMSPTGEVQGKCKECVVYRIRAAWCFEVMSAEGSAGHARSHCAAQGACSECPYYGYVYGLASRVLIITPDPSLRSALESENCGAISAKFAADAYEASALMASDRPGFVVLDARGSGGLDLRLLDHLTNDPRAPGLRVILYGSAAADRPISPRAHWLAKDRLSLRDIADSITAINNKGKQEPARRPNRSSDQ